LFHFSGAWNNSRSMIGKTIAYDWQKSRVSNLKKQGKSWLPITMIGNFGNAISSPVVLACIFTCFAKNVYQISFWGRNKFDI
jgi:hypothetical protein